MRVSFRNLILSSAALCTTVAFAAEQRRVEVPFNFVAQDHAYQAGSYAVSVDVSRSLVTLREIGKPGHTKMWIMAPGVGDPSRPDVSLTFDVTGQSHVLRTIQYETYITPNLNAKPKHNIERTTTTVGE